MRLPAFGRQKSFSILLLIAFAILQAPSTQAASCRDLFVPGREVIETEVYPREPAPVFHSTNIKEAYRYLDSQTQPIVFQRNRFSEQLDLLCAGAIPCLHLISIHEHGDRKKFIVKDSHGKTFAISGEVLKSGKHEEYTLRFADRVPLPQSHEAISLSAQENLRLVQSERWNLQAPELADRLTSLQLESSTNYKYRKEKSLIAEGVKNAYQLIVGKLVSNRALTRKDLDAINEEMNVTINALYNTPWKDQRAGAMRGTRDHIWRSGSKPLRMDMSHAQVWQQIHDGKGLSVIMMHFPPAKDVPNLMDRLLRDVNQLSRTTPLETAFEIYQDFIRIHPYMDGNGRTGRVLLNYMLLKSGFPPSKTPSESLGYSPVELAKKYIETEMQMH